MDTYKIRLPILIFFSLKNEPFIYDAGEYNIVRIPHGDENMKKLSLDEMTERVVDRPQTAGQLARYREVLQKHPSAIVLFCSDEKTGQRFGRARKRAGQCQKIGGARQPYWYQAWATWSSADI